MKPPEKKWFHILVLATLLLTVAILCGMPRNDNSHLRGLFSTLIRCRSNNTWSAFKLELY